MKTTQVALYARVSSEQQNEARTIESQMADLRARIAATGADLPAELEFVDNGYSGATLIRPALERLRDVAAAGGIDQLYVHCPDRLARKLSSVLPAAHLLPAQECISGECSDQQPGCAPASERGNLRACESDWGRPPGQ